MARQQKFGPHRPDAPALAKRQRVLSLIGTWLFVLVFMVAPIGFGMGYFVVPGILFVVLLIATTRITMSGNAPETEALHLNELKTATPAQPISVHGVWAPRLRVRGEPPIKGFLVCDGKRLRFENHDGLVRFDAVISEITVVTVPSFMRPQLDITIGGVMQTVRFFSPLDLGATFVGPIVAGEWFAQLRELGAS